MYCSLVITLDRSSVFHTFSCSGDILNTLPPDLGVVCYESCVACISGLDENAAATFTLMPNPAQTSFNIVSTEAITEIELVDLSGKSVRKVAGTTNVNVADLVQGMYTVIVRSENGTSTSRVIVE